MHLLKDIAIKDSVTLYENSTWDEAYFLFLKNRIDILPILDKYFHVIGIITKSDIIKYQAKRIDPTIPIKKNLLTSIVTVIEDIPIIDILKSYSSSIFPIAIVNNRNEFSGLVTTEVI
ncbi:MAG: CBS domain-containing protein [Thermodesulfobacteriota bacterium]|nr:CBS domain-containing protein [Thermodesulfobacteriota bacterium]